MIILIYQIPIMFFFRTTTGFTLMNIIIYRDNC